MMGVSDNNAPKNINSKGNQSELKKPLQVLQLNKKSSKNDTSKNSSMNKKLSSNSDVSNTTKQKDYELESETLNTNSLVKETQYKNHEESNLSFVNLEKPQVPIIENKINDDEIIVDEFDFDAL